MGSLFQFALACVWISLALRNLKEKPLSTSDTVKTLKGLLFFAGFALLGFVPFIMNIEEGVQKSSSEALFGVLLVCSYLALGFQFLIAYVPKGSGALIQANSVYKPLVWLNVLVILFAAFKVYG